MSDINAVRGQSDESVAIGNIASLITDGENLEDEGKAFQVCFDTIYQIIDDLKTSWTGDSAKRYTDNIESYRQDLNDFASLVKGLGGLINEIGKQYDNLEKNL